jgi:hypothetical protein
VTALARVEAALAFMLEARRRLGEWDEEPDPVTQRRLQVKAAALLRRAADELDDGGRLAE